MSDATLIQLLKEAIRVDVQKPIINQRLNPVDPVDIEIAMHEADFAVEQYMKKWEHFRAKFEDPSVYDNFLLEFQMKARRNVKSMIATAQQMLANKAEQEEWWEEEEEPPEDEGDYQI